MKGYDMSQITLYRIDGTDKAVEIRPTFETTRGWMPYRTAARKYLGVGDDLLREAINAHELDAYEKPRTTPPKRGGVVNHSYFVNLAEVDEYIRTHWQKVVRI